MRGRLGREESERGAAGDGRGGGGPALLGSEQRKKKKKSEGKKKKRARAGESSGRLGIETRTAWASSGVVQHGTAASRCSPRVKRA